MGQDTTAKEFSYYAIVGTHASASDEEIRNAYYASARRKHPDKGGTSDQFAELSLAYSEIRNANARARLAKFLDLLGTRCHTCSGTGCTRRSRGFTGVETAPCQLCCGAAFLPR